MSALAATATDITDELMSLTADICARALAPQASEAERAARFPRAELRTLGDAGLLALPYPEEYGGAAMPAEIRSVPPASRGVDGRRRG